MDKTNIRMYLTYWFRENPREEEVVKALSETGIGEYRYVRTKRGGRASNFFRSGGKRGTSSRSRTCFWTGASRL